MPIFHPTAPAKHPHFPSTVCAKKKKEHACFHTQKEKSPGWHANIQRALLHTQRFLSDLAIRDHPTSPPPFLALFLPVFLIFWLQIERDRQYKNPSIWLLTEKKLKTYSVPSALWLMNNVGWLGGIVLITWGKLIYRRFNMQIGPGFKNAFKWGDLCCCSNLN